MSPAPPDMCVRPALASVHNAPPPEPEAAAEPEQAADRSPAAHAAERRSGSVDKSFRCDHCRDALRPKLQARAVVYAYTYAAQSSSLVNTDLGRRGDPEF